MPQLHLCLALLFGVSEAAPTPPVIDGASAARWQACTAWVQNRPAKFAVTNEGGVLVFTAEGPRTELPWLLNLDDFGFTGDERYLLIRYQATGMNASAGNYFLHGQEGTVGGRTYALARELQPDGGWHTLAVDLLALEPLEPTRGLALKVIVGDGPAARLCVERIWFADELPAEVQVAKAMPRGSDPPVIVAWQKVGALTAQPGWTPTPAAEHSATLEGTTLTFRVRGSGRGMRWLLKLPQPIDLAATPYLSTRYRASGQLAPTTYAIWLGQTGGGDSVIPLFAGDVRPDGLWHNVCLKVREPLRVKELAIGLDCAAEQAELTLDTLQFTSRPRRWTVAETLPHDTRDQPWPTGQDGFVAGTTSIRGGRTSAFLLPRMELSDWFQASHVTVAGIPFQVERDPARLPQSGVNSRAALACDLPPEAREIFLLVANSAPATEPWGLEEAHPRAQELLDVPEKVYYEIRYDSGPPDRVLPLDAATGRWGLRRGLSVSVVHPDPARRPRELLLHDQMQTASFAIVAATTRRGEPRNSEPNWDALAYGPLPVDPLRVARPAAAAPGEAAVHSGVLQARFDTAAGLNWSQLSVSGIADGLACDDGPVFGVTRAGRSIAAGDWQLVKLEPLGAGRRFRLQNAPAQLAAQVDCLPGAGNELLLRMGLTNTGTQPTTVTLHFPLLRGLRFGAAADTWYLIGKRGGLIHSVPVRCREPLGEPHPLQVDGFFSPRHGLALACLTHDTVAQHHFINAGKSAAGGEWHPEYVERDLRPGETFQATEAALVLRAGDWRAIFAAYTDWLGTWFQPEAPRKAWFERAFAMASDNAHFEAIADPQQRGALERVRRTMLAHLGHCDYLHLFGWSASREFGDWGDYDHYDQTVGGLDYFRQNIARTQETGTAVSLYLDGYLSSAKGQAVGGRAPAWALRRPDGTPQYVEAYQAYNQCPYLPGWQDHLSETYRRVLRELAPRALYIDEYGATDGRWICHAQDHGHNGYEIPYAGEVAMLRRIRAAVGPETVLYTEYPPAEVSRRYLDGSITYQALWSADQEPLAPHFIDLPRFAFPDFKQLHIIHYVGTRAGNWWLFKFPFFNGEVYRIGVPNLAGMDEPSREFLKRAVQIQCAHREAFASHTVQPLVPTEVNGVYANLFQTLRKRVWTLYNANGRNVRLPVLRVPHVAGATYEDAWNAVPLTPAVRDGQAYLQLDLGPKSVGCVVQKTP